MRNLSASKNDQQAVAGAVSIPLDTLQTLVHEFQTPIAAIRMAADVLASPIARDDAERQEKYVRIIREETERLQHQVETILGLARAHRNELFVCVAPVDVHDLIRKVLERHEGYVTCTLEGASPGILADELHLTNVLHNLLDNAIKYSAGKPDICIATTLTENELTISVRDHGIGIPESLQHRIFEPFFRVGEKHVSAKGFGLGLSYVQEIMEAHQWYMTLNSKEGQGSEFSIHVPNASFTSLPFQPA
ncbi:sensor histidine kinase [Arsenicibacter rosenii]|uniref:sensor histidine kinase n=1 Tax=Arsenicibacter rosenii TaxID=1750698 RepID=UPI0009F658E6|nr:HAMP domain-containing sensor histidine kinase [Arsenicibacter rosenii]